MKHKIRKLLTVVCSFGILMGMIGSTSAVDTRASTIPTSLAPDSWYIVDHQWTCKSLTYSSYYFDLGIDGYAEINARCDKPFTLEVYNLDGELLVSDRASYRNSAYRASIEEDYTVIDRYFYIVLKNTNSNTSITLDDDAYYSVYVIPNGWA
ncbi:hypothetical protein [Pseudoflavonifractor capillosus]|uniref:hypothetical protein n=1 Tax=Pseudoflavonifractor capillosus TaxID=106588 RepID=UPI00195EE189|nr:hypothetical protein [Pseudoflavonifractor capillosus]MBM6682067.1 hypothetical protein [Pseudoflavonifractor capillosus]